MSLVEVKRPRDNQSAFLQHEQDLPRLRLKAPDNSFDENRPSLVEVEGLQTIDQPFFDKNRPSVVKLMSFPLVCSLEHVKKKGPSHKKGDWD